MPAGERSQTWFPELVEHLQASWRTGMTWNEVVELRDELQQHLNFIRTSRKIEPARMRCPKCGGIATTVSEFISIRAMLLALQRFGIESKEEVAILEKSWARHRKLQKLDLYGRPISEGGAKFHNHDVSLP